MNRKSLLGIVALLVALLAGAGSALQNPKPKAPPASKPLAKPAGPKAFKGQMYRSIDGRTTMTMVSADELELAQGGVNLICKYTQQDNVVRIVVNRLGATEAVYYQVVAEGLQDREGRILYSSTGLEKARQQAEVARQQAAEQARREAQWREEAARVAREAENQRQQAAIDRFPEVATGMIKDTKTGLLWLKSPLRMSHPDALKACAATSSPLPVGWGMPSRREFETLLQEGAREWADTPDGSFFGKAQTERNSLISFFVTDEAGADHAWSWSKSHAWRPYGTWFSDALTLCVGRPK